MPVHIVRNDITQMAVDAIVNAAKPSLLGGGGVDGCIHRAAGPRLLEECAKLGGCATGEAKITKGYNLPSKYVIHTVGPVWQGGDHGEPEALRRCYLNSLALAARKKCASVAFPLISSGIYGYPKDKALRVAVDAIGEFLADHELEVYIVVFDKAAFQIGEKLYADIREYIDDRYASAHSDSKFRRLERMNAMEFMAAPVNEAAPMSCSAPSPVPRRLAKAKSLKEAVGMIDESFSEMLLRKIDEKGMSDAQCYKKANIDRKLFSKIRSDKHYKPSKPTAIAFAIALELSLEETREMLLKAGFALSHSNEFDIIIEYFISHGNYNIFEINEALFAFDQNLLGA